MPFKSRRSRLKLTPEVREALSEIARSRTEPLQRIERAKTLLDWTDGASVSQIARDLHTNRQKVERCIDKALKLGAIPALEDLPRTGRTPSITPEARTWVVSLACQKPRELGHPHELWTTRLLAAHVREHCQDYGHPTLSRVSSGTIVKILNKAEVKPHKISYYLEKRDPEFESKMEQVLCVYREVELLRAREEEVGDLTAIVSYDEKPGIQAIENKAPDLPPVPGKHPTVGRDYEYVRHGTVSLMAGIDLLSGRIHANVVDRHRSREFVEFLKGLDAFYPEGTRIRVILDNHSAHTSKETRAYLSTVPNRFEFTFTPKHGSWLNLIETFFSKLARSLLRGIRVSSREELKERLHQYIRDLNEAPVVFRWKRGIDALDVM